MRTASSLLLLPSLGTVALAIALPARAAPIYASAQVQAHVGYGSNPYLVEDDSSGSLLAGIRLMPQLTTRTATSESSLSGFYDYTGYTKRYGHSDAYGVDARHSQQFSERLSGNIHAGFVDSLNSVYGATDVADEVTLGRRQRRFGGDFGLTYQPSERDQFTLVGQIWRATYPGRNGSTSLSPYTDYGATASYMRALSDRTRVGVSLGVDRYESRYYGDTTSILPSIVLDQRLGTDWRLNAHAGAILNRTTFGSFTDRRTTIGFGAKLCKENPRYLLCVEGSRDNAPSGLGGLRTDTHGVVSLDYKLSERSSANGSLAYGHSSTRSTIGGPSLGLLNQDYLNANAGYSYRLTERISIGGTGSYLYRKFEGRGTAHGVSGALTVTASFGRTK